MALTLEQGVLPGPPWGLGEWRGRLDQLVVHSEILEGNALGDPSSRPLYVYVPPGVEPSGDLVPTIYLIQGFTGQIDMWLARVPFAPNMIERLEDLFVNGGAAPAVVVMVDAWTSLGGSQFVNSVATGRYMDYLCDEVVPFVEEHYPVLASRDHRGLTGKSSGGYGAMVVPMMRPDVFGAFASHAGDALFEYCYQREFPEVIRALRDHYDGSYDRFFQEARSAVTFDWDKYGSLLEVYAMAAAYSPDEERPGEVVLPFDIASGRMIDDVWARWLAWDPVRIAPTRLEALASMRLIYLDAGRSDEYFLDIGAQAFSAELEKGGIPHTFELFDGKHGGISYRYPLAIRALADALSRPA